ncbi:MAG: flagellar biosynthesis protein FlhB [Planctomycetaceae bacterium]|nr:flagellar biosynthesis protein FlhB [Planctomycetaceae bacterium]
MAADDSGDRTEDPTDRKRSEARQQGNVARSTDLSSAAHMLAAACVLLVFGPRIVEAIGRLLVQSLSQTRLNITAADASELGWSIGNWGAGTMIPVMGLLLLIALATSLGQVGFLFSSETLQPKLSRLNPLEGMKRLFQVQALARLVASLLKIGVLVAITAWYVMVELPTFAQLAGSSVAGAYGRIGESIVFLAFLLAVSLMVLGVLDFAFQKWKHEQDLKMTKQEIREEMKNMEGDPLIRQRRKEAHRKLAEARELGQVSDADVVVTNPTHVAVALKYDPEQNDAPVVIAKGMGELAMRIRQIAVGAGVPILERKELARTLYRTVQVNHPIPAEMYGVFVEIMAYVYGITGRDPANLSRGRDVSR